MPKAKDPSGQKPLPAGAPGKAKKADKAFDVWLQRGLHQLYGKIAEEPIPDELLKLIDEDRSK